MALPISNIPILTGAAAASFVENAKANGLSDSLRGRDRPLLKSFLLIPLFLF